MSKLCLSPERKMAYIELEKSLMEEKDLMQKMGAKAFKAMAQRRVERAKESNIAV